MAETEIQQPKQRLQWLDALRGFTMILVVAYHVGLQGFGEDVKASSSLSFFILFRMPLFFFISGFLAYKAQMVWTKNRLGMSIWKKFKIQLIPTLVFLFVALMMKYPHPWESLTNYILISPTKGGYWFTLVLLYMFIIYYIFAYIESKFPMKSWIPITILWFIALVCYAILYMPSWFDWPKPNEPVWWNYTCFIQVMQYFHYFIFGNIVHRYWDKWQKVFDSKWFFPLIVFMALICCCDIFRWHLLRLQWTNLPRTITIYTLMMIVFLFFRHYQDVFTKEHRRGRFLQYIGVRTLDIYLIHFLFLPNLKDVGEFLNQTKQNFVLDTTLSVIFGIVIIGFCCLVSNVLRVSPIFKKYLFGRK